MGRLSEAPLPCKLILAFSLICFILYSIAIPQPYWLKFKKTISPHPPTANFPVHVKVHIGLFRACKNVKAVIPQGTLVIEDWCRSKDAPKWHEAAAVLGAIAIFCGLAQHIINVLSITMKRMADKVIYKFISAGCSALAAGFMIPVLVLMDVNRDNYRGLHYDLHYCYILATIGMAFYFVLSLVILAEIFFHRDKEDTAGERLWTEQKDGEASTRYT